MAGTSYGRMRQVAATAGLSVEEYQERASRGLKRCSTCHKWKLRAQDFAANRCMPDGRCNVCCECSSLAAHRRYVPVPPRPPREVRVTARIRTPIRVQDKSRRPIGGPPKPPRDGDKRQAIHRVNYYVDIGRLPDPNSIPCSACGHVGDNRKHNYHHHKGYGSAHHLDVIVLCVRCHRSAHGATRIGECSPRTSLICKRCGRQFRVLNSYLKNHGIQENCSLECRYGHPIKRKNCGKN